MKRVNILKRTSLIMNKVDILCKKINHNDFSNEAKSKLQLVREALIEFKSWIDFEFSQHKSIEHQHESIDNLPVNVPTIELINTNENVETEDSCNVKNEISEANIKEEIDDELIEEDSFVFASNIAGKHFPQIMIIQFADKTRRTTSLFSEAL